MILRSLVSIAFGIGCFTTVMVSAVEPEERTPYYEDDAWYDISEWFDGNDYNPTDEAIGRWDDESYALSDDTARDHDNDVDWSKQGYGFDEARDDDNWTYDFYADDSSDWSDSDNDGVYEHSRQYYDDDHDGVYDAFATFSDSDGDGVYDDYQYQRMDKSNDAAASNGARTAQAEQKTRRGRMIRPQGTVASTKQVKTKLGKNFVVRLNGDDGKAYTVDLGPDWRLEKKPQQGEEIVAIGPVVKLGDQQILLARKVEMNGNDIVVNRVSRVFDGEIVSTKKVQVRNREHLFAKIKTTKGKQLMADLGPTDQVSTNLTEGKKITVTGEAVKIDDRRVLFANSFQYDGQILSVMRTRS